MKRPIRGPVLDFHARLGPAPEACQRLMSVMAANGIARAVVSAGGVIDLGRLSRQLVEGGHISTDADNDAVLRAAAGSDGRLVPWYFANPHRPADHYRERVGEFRGLEISPAVHGIPLTDDRVSDLVAVAAAHGQATYVVCLSRPGCGVRDLLTLARRHPTATFVLGHSGVGNIDYYAIDLIADHPGIVLETSGGYSSVLRAAMDRLGAERVLFGSEYPLQHPSVELAKYAVLDLTPNEWAQVTWVNAHRLLKESPR